VLTTTPSWLYYFFGSLMLAVAAYGLMLLILALPTRRTLGWDVDISHAFMGVSMAGMFVTQWSFGPHAVWELIFAVLLIWFLVRSIQSIQRWGLHLSHFLIHAVMSFAMLSMYWFPMQARGAASTGSMSMSSAGPRLDPGLAFLLAFTLFASAIFTLASPNKGASHHGTHGPAFVMSGTNSAANHPHEGPSSGGIAVIVSAPVLEDISHAVMCVGMGFMLILMI